jgi:hypothetical protein
LRTCGVDVVVRVAHICPADDCCDSDDKDEHYRFAALHAVRAALLQRLRLVQETARRPR